MPQWLRTSLRLSVVVLAVATVSVLGLCVARAFVDYDALRSSSDSLGTFVQTLGGIYAVLLAFVVVAVWSQYNDARGHVDREANVLVDLHRTASGLPASSRKAIQAGLRDYLDAVIADEWAAMARRDQVTLDQIGSRLDEVWLAIHACVPANECHSAMYSEIISLFNDLTQHRANRLNAAATKVPVALNVLLYTGALIMIGSVYLLAFDKLWLHATVTAGMAGAIAHILFLIYDLDTAFSGDWQVEKSALLRARRAFDRTAHIGHAD